jgi:ABC-type proline/glycine betaine transport system permease subunit
MKPKKSILDYIFDFLEDYLWDKVIGTFLISTIASALSFVIFGNPFGGWENPNIYVTVDKVFEVIGTGSAFVSLVSFVPAVVRSVEVLIDWLVKHWP